MNVPRRSGPSPTHSVGGGRTWRPATVYFVIALGLAAAAFAALLFSSGSPKDVTRDGTDPTESPALLPPPAMPGTPPSIPDGVDPKGELSIEVFNQVARDAIPTISDLIKRLHEAGIFSGIGAFNPPGTRPHMVGLAVPEDFVLPKGYVRHHQATDDGQRIEAILMFDPDHRPVDANNQPIAVPKDRVVTPELAPPGFPIRRIVLPEPVEQEGQ